LGWNAPLSLSCFWRRERSGGEQPGRVQVEFDRGHRGRHGQPMRSLCCVVLVANSPSREKVDCWWADGNWLNWRHDSGRGRGFPGRSIHPLTSCSLCFLFRQPQPPHLSTSSAAWSLCESFSKASRSALLLSFSSIVTPFRLQFTNQQTTTRTKQSTTTSRSLSPRHSFTTAPFNVQLAPLSQAKRLDSRDPSISESSKSNRASSNAASTRSSHHVQPQSRVTYQILRIQFSNCACQVVSSVAISIPENLLSRSLPRSDLIIDPLRDESPTRLHLPR
jgi:hypothetical protein